EHDRSERRALDLPCQAEARSVGQLHIDHSEVPATVGQRTLCICDGLHPGDVELFAREPLAQRPPERRFVLDDQHPCHQAASGRAIVTSSAPDVPPVSAKSIVPPIRAMRRRLTCRPTPVPLVGPGRRKASPSRFRSVTAGPWPLSATTMRTVPSPVRAIETVTCDARPCRT